MITKIKWKNHNILSNLELDFRKEDGSAYNTIVIAGENGTGKTTILDTLVTFLSGGAITPFDYIQYMINKISLRVYYERDKENLDKYGFHKRHNLSANEVEVINRNRSNYYEQMMNDQLDLRSYGVIYSKARSGFKTNPIKVTTISQLDNEKNSIDDEEDYTKIKQLIVDISSQDNANLSNLAEMKNGVPETDYEYYIKNSKMQRFKSAFNSFFYNIKFDRIDEESIEEKRILFKKYDQEISIDSLSSGEKQVVFRGSYLLKNQKMLKGGIVLIDEPELSMHPLWQEKVLKYYKDLFTVDGNQTVQIIVATHSEYVIKSALEDRENTLVIALKDVEGNIEGHRVDVPKILPTITLAETNYNAFNIVSNDYHIQLYGYLQTLNGNDRVSDCAKGIENYINSHSNIDKDIHLKRSSYTDKRGNTKNYYTLSTYIRNAIDHPDNGNQFTDKQLKASIELLIEIINFEKLKTNNWT